MSGINSLVNTIVDSMDAKTSKDTKPYDIRAEIRNIKDGVAWVHFPGGVDETPVDLTINANVGDVVQVRVSGGRAWITGNATSPPTDDRRANVAFYTANEASSQASAAAVAADNAQIFAESAQQSANEANEILDGMKEVAEEADLTLQETIGYAIAAHEDLIQIESDLEQADIAATNASKSAQRALYGLENIENVVGAINWISQHGYYVKSIDTAIVTGKAYYTLTGTAVGSPTGSPMANRYYERTGSGTSDSPYIYTRSSDTSVNSQKTYYSVIASISANPTGNPSTIPYYELNYDESVVQYVNTHLALTDAGLIISDGSSNQMLISSNEIKIYGPNGLASKFGDETIIGNPNGYHVKITGGKLSFMRNSNYEVAWISGEKLVIPSVVVVNSMQAGNWLWDAGTNQSHFTLRWNEVSSNE